MLNCNILQFSAFILAICVEVNAAGYVHQRSLCRIKTLNLYYANLNLRIVFDN